MQAREVVELWVQLFNAGDALALSELYHKDAINHQVANVPIEGRSAIYEMFKKEFDTAKMVCIVEHIYQDGDWAILEWKDPLGLRGSGFFKVDQDQIVFQRGYWDKLSFLKAHNLPIE